MDISREEIARRNFLAGAAGSLRFSGNVYGFHFEPSIAILAADIRKLAASLRDARQPLEQSIKRVMIPSIEQNFLSEGRPPWEPLSVDTIRRRAKKGFAPSPILRRTNNLKRVATSFSIWSVSQSTAVIRDLPSSAWYGAIHQAGTNVSGSNWFGRYQSQAQGILSSGSRRGLVISQREIDRLAWRLFDRDILRGNISRRGNKAEVPQRRFIMFQNADFDAIVRIFYEWIDERTRVDGKFMPGGPR